MLQGSGRLPTFNVVVSYLDPIMISVVSKMRTLTLSPAKQMCPIPYFNRTLILLPDIEVLAKFK